MESFAKSVLLKKENCYREQKKLFQHDWHIKSSCQ